MRRWASTRAATEAGVAEDAEMFRDLGLGEMEAMDEVIYGEGTFAEEFDDVEAIGFGEGFEGLQHGGF